MATQPNEHDELANRLAEVIDDAALTHCGRSIGVLASRSVAVEVLAFLRENG